MLNQRMRNPAEVLPDAIRPLQTLYGVIQSAGVPAKTLGLVHLRTSQINGCGFCVDGGVKHAKQAGETDERLHLVAAWREAPYFDEAERAALDLAESMTRMADRGDPVSDAVWNEAAKHFDEEKLGGLVLYVGLTNLYNRVNVTTRQPAGKGW
jgi:AhpD family alkylhydroperoxidase